MNPTETNSPTDEQRAPKPHNPDRLTPEQVGVADGWRLLDEDEAEEDKAAMVPETQVWWPWGWGRTTKHWPQYQSTRTKLTRAELRAARGLPLEEASLAPETAQGSPQSLKTMPDTSSAGQAEGEARTETPRTDLAVKEFEFSTVMLGGEIGGDYKEIIDPEFARQLERELTATIADRDRLASAFEGAKQIISTTEKKLRQVEQERDDFEGRLSASGADAMDWIDRGRAAESRAEEAEAKVAALEVERDEAKKEANQARTTRRAYMQLAEKKHKTDKDERDTIAAKLAASEAACAQMREALGDARRFLGDSPFICSEVEAALATDAGASLLAELAAWRKAGELARPFVDRVAKADPWSTDYGSIALLDAIAAADKGQP